MLLGLAAGKIGDLVFYRDGGEQRTRTRVIPKNPRSIAQQTQRSKIANVSALYRLFAVVLQDSFVNRPSNQSGFNAFAATAIASSPYMTRSQAAVDCVLPQPAIVSKGTLPDFGPGATSMVNDDFVAIVIQSEGGADTTIAAVSAELLATNPTFANGDVLTFIAARFRAGNATDEGDDTYTAQPIVASFKIDTSDTRKVSEVGFEASTYTLKPDSYSTVLEGAVNASAVILSRVSGDGVLQVNTQSLTLSPSASEVYESYRSDAARDAAVASYMGTNVSILRD